jgi:serine/threonine protein kinase
VNLDHPNICRYLDIEEIENKNPFGENEIIQVCVMELLDGGNILEYYKKNEDHQLLIKLLRDILNGLAYLHRHGIIHRDIKPANILIKSALEGPVAKITDFGISKATDNLSSNSSSALVVSIPYMAPEQLNIKKYGLDEKIASNLDLWSLGVTIYEIVTGKVLFKNSDKDSSEQVMANIMSPQLPEKINELPEPFRKIVSMCVVKNARERVQKAEALLQVLETAVAAQNRQTMVNNNSNSDNNKGGLFLEEVAVEKTATPPSPPSVRAAWLQRIPVFFKTHSMKMIVGTAAILFVAVLLLAIRFFNDRRAHSASAVPATAKDTNAVRQPANNTPAQSATTITSLPQSPNNNAALTTPDKEPVQEKKTTPEPKKHRNSNNREEEPEHDRKETLRANEKSMVEITTGTRCSIRIESPANGYNEFLPSLRSSIQIPMPPGKYYITAINLQTKAEYRHSFTVKPGKRASFSIPGNF